MLQVLRTELVFSNTIERACSLFIYLCSTMAHGLHYCFLAHLEEKAANIVAVKLISVTTCILPTRVKVLNPGIPGPNWLCVANNLEI